MIPTASAENLIDEIEDALGTILVSDARDTNVSGFRLLDRIQGARVHGSNRAHLGVSVSIPETRNTGRLRGRDSREVEDAVEILLLHQVSPHDQKQTRTDALGHEALIRDRLDRMRAWDPSYQRTNRALVEGWLETRIRMRFRRIEALALPGGV